MGEYRVLRTETESRFAARFGGHLSHSPFTVETAQAALNSTASASADTGIDIVAVSRQRPTTMTVGDLIAFLATVDPALPVRTFREGQGEYGSDDDVEAVSVAVRDYEDGYLCISSQDHGAVDERWVVTGVEISEAEVTELRADFVAKRRAAKQAEKARLLDSLAKELGVKIVP